MYIGIQNSKNKWKSEVKEATYNHKFEKLVRIKNLHSSAFFLQAKVHSIKTACFFRILYLFISICRGNIETVKF